MSNRFDMGLRGAALTFGLLAAAAGCTLSTRATPPPSLSPPPPSLSPPEPVVGVTGPSGGNLVQLAGQARSVQTTAGVGGLGSFHLAGAPVLTVASVDVVDAGGHDLGTGSLTAQGSDLVVAGAGLTLGGTFRVQPSTVTIDGATVSLPDATTVTAARITFQPPAPAASPGAPSAPPAPAAVTVAGPATIRTTSGASGGVAGSGLRWADAPASIVVSSGEADLSWAGSGTIMTAGGVLKAGYLGVRAQQLAATLQRTGGEVLVSGTGLALQAYADGVPQIRTPARMDVLSTSATTGSFFSLKPAFVWTPRNLGSTYDMAILSIHPGNPAASGVHLSLSPMPPMFGGEPHALVGGDTSGLKSGAPIDALIARNGDDKRSIGYDAPAHATLVLIVGGNFDPITVTVQTP